MKVIYTPAELVGVHVRFWWERTLHGDGIVTGHARKPDGAVFVYLDAGAEAPLLVRMTDVVLPTGMRWASVYEQLANIKE